MGDEIVGMRSSGLSPSYHICVMVFVDLLFEDPDALYLALWRERDRRDREHTAASSNEARGDEPEAPDAG